jgi:hypothetical protein
VEAEHDQSVRAMDMLRDVRRRSPVPVAGENWRQIPSLASAISGAEP